MEQGRPIPVWCRHQEALSLFGALGAANSPGVTDSADPAMAISTTRKTRDRRGLARSWLDMVQLRVACAGAKRPTSKADPN